MNYYGPKELAASYRTVRKNTLTIAEDIPENEYSYRPAEGTMSVAELLTHIALAGRFQEQVNLIERRTSMVGFDFPKLMAEVKAQGARYHTKAEIIDLLKDEGERFANALESLTDEFLGETVAMPPGGNPASRTRFDMLMTVKEHEMHHRGQLMLIERLLGIKPHLTREQEARLERMRAAALQTT